jgi:prephenate dehydrogenase
MHHLNNISVIGMGLIGGSIVKTWKKKKPHAKIGSLRADFADLQQASKEGWVDQLFDSWKELMAWSDLIILATPLSTIPDVALEMSRHCPENKPLLIIDIGSVKKEIVPTFEKLTKGNIEFLSTHPMAGKEKWGFANSDPDLFERRPWIVTPHGKNRDETVKQIGAWIKIMGADPIVLSLEEHDSQTALVSHLPALLSRLLAQFVEERDPDALKIAGPCFHSTTRVARDNPQLWAEINALNREKIHDHFAALLKFIEEQTR